MHWVSARVGFYFLSFSTDFAEKVLDLWGLSSRASQVCWGWIWRVALYTEQFTNIEWLSGGWKACLCFANFRHILEMSEICFFSFLKSIKTTYQIRFQAVILYHDLVPCFILCRGQLALSSVSGYVPWCVNINLADDMWPIKYMQWIFKRCYCPVKMRLLTIVKQCKFKSGKVTTCFTVLYSGACILFYRAVS